MAKVFAMFWVVRALPILSSSARPRRLVRWKRVPEKQVRLGLALSGSGAAFTLVEMMIVVAIIGLLAAIAVPNFVRSRMISQRNACINNLRQMDAAKQQWAFDSHATLATVPAILDIQPYLGHGAAGSQPTCPADSQGSFASSYLINEIQKVPVCQISPLTHQIEARVGQPVDTSSPSSDGGNSGPGGGHDGGHDGGDGSGH